MLNSNKLEKSSITRLNLAARHILLIMMYRFGFFSPIASCFDLFMAQILPDSGGFL